MDRAINDFHHGSEPMLLHVQSTQHGFTAIQKTVQQCRGLCAIALESTPTPYNAAVSYGWVHFMSDIPLGFCCGVLCVIGSTRTPYYTAPYYTALIAMALCHSVHFIGVCYGVFDIWLTHSFCCGVFRSCVP